MWNQFFSFFFDKSLGQTFFAQAKVFSHTPHQRQVISAPHLATINIWILNFDVMAYPIWDLLLSAISEIFQTISSNQCPLIYVLRSTNKHPNGLNAIWISLQPWSMVIRPRKRPLMTSYFRVGGVVQNDPKKIRYYRVKIISHGR